MKENIQTNSIGNLLIQLNKLRRKKSNALLSAVGIHSGQDVLLYYLGREDGQTVSALAEKLNITQATISTMIHRMEASGVIRKEKDVNDKRTSRIYLSAKGKKALAEIYNIWNSMEKQTTKGFTEDQKNKLIALLMAALKNLE